MGLGGSSIWGRWYNFKKGGQNDFMRKGTFEQRLRRRGNPPGRSLGKEHSRQRGQPVQRP